MPLAVKCPEFFYVTYYGITDDYIVHICCKVNQCISYRSNYLKLRHYSIFNTIQPFCSFLFQFETFGKDEAYITCLQLFYIEQDKAAYEQKKNAFLDGYRSVLNVPDEELELIPYAGLAIWIYYLGVQAERFDYFANVFLTDNYVKMYIGKVMDWMKYNDVKIK